MWRTVFTLDGVRVASCRHAQVGLVGHVGNLWVRRPFRKRGIGSAVMGIVEQNARMGGCHTMRLTAHQLPFGHTVMFFEGLGFQKGNFGSVVDDGVDVWDAVPMSKKIEPAEVPFLDTVEFSVRSLRTHSQKVRLRTA